MNHQPIRLDREMPQAEGDVLQLHATARRVLERAHHLTAYAPLKIRSPRVPRRSNGHQSQQRNQRQNTPPKDTQHSAAPLWSRWRRCIWRRVCHDVFAHGASSPGCSTTTLPCARKLCSQSSNSFDTRCCSSTSWIRFSIVRTGGGATCCAAYCGSIVFV